MYLWHYEANLVCIVRPCLRNKTKTKVQNQKKTVSIGSFMSVISKLVRPTQEFSMSLR